MMTELTSGTVGLVSHGVAAAAFVLLAILSILNWKQGRIGIWLIAGAAVTALWAGVKALASMGVGWAVLLAVPLETLRSGAWIGFLLVLLAGDREETRPGWLVRWFGPLLVAAVVLLFAAEAGEVFFALQYGGLAFPAPTIFGKLVLAVGGLLLIENLFRNTAPEARWNVKFLCLGLGALFIYDLYLYANGLLFQRLDLWVLEARGLVNALIVPLLAVSAARNPDWKVDLFISRSLAFYSATLMASGAYLVVMALVGYYIREVGGSWGALLQVAFLFGAGVLLVVILFSGRFRTRLKVFISKHFFNYRYDYREEWLRFIRTISEERLSGGLRERAIKAIGDIVESPGGVLLLDRGNGDFAVAAAWNLPPDMPVLEPAESPLLRYLMRRQWIVDIHEARQDPEFYDHLVLPDWVEEIAEAWLIVPLIHHDQLIGAVILQEARAPRDLNWEDRDLLKTVGRQVASYLAAQESARALAEARQFEAFNRRFAFVLHDIKNLVSQLSLMMSNAEKHADNPEFQKDMMATVQESVTKMKALLERLHSNTVEPAEEQADLKAVLDDVSRRKQQAGQELTLRLPRETLWVRGDAERLTTVFNHLVQNALDAAGDEGRVEIRVAEQDASVRVEVADNGPGMAPDFVRNHLFRPFRSMKSGGYGIGAYESRQIVLEAGGSLDVHSKVGEGTTVLVNLRKPSSSRGADDERGAGQQVELESK